MNLHLMGVRDEVIVRQIKASHRRRVLKRIIRILFFAW